MRHHHTRQLPMGIAGCRLLMALLANAATAAGRSPAPAPHCLDARAMREAHQVDARTLAILGENDVRHRIDLAASCPTAAGSGAASLLAREGWVCGGGNEFVRDGQTLCPITAVTTVDAREYARLARTSQASDGTASLGTVEVRGERRRGFGGSSSYCFSPRHMRSWSEDGKGVLVELSPARSGGHRYYRVELGNACPELNAAPQIGFESGLGVGVICGNPGDRIKVVEQRSETMPGAPRLMGTARIGCPISAVYPIIDEVPVEGATSSR